MQVINAATGVLLTKTAEQLVTFLLDVQFNEEAEKRELATRGLQLHEEGASWYLLRKTIVFLPSLFDPKVWTDSKSVIKEVNHIVVFLCVVKWMLERIRRQRDNGERQDRFWNFDSWARFKAEEELKTDPTKRNFCILDVVERASLREMKVLNFILANRGKNDAGIYQFMSDDFRDYPSSKLGDPILNVFWEGRFYETTPEGRYSIRPTYERADVSHKFYLNLDGNFRNYSKSTESYYTRLSVYEDPTWLPDLRKCRGSTLVLAPFPIDEGMAKKYGTINGKFNTLLMLGTVS
jgi:hypothetical protein